MWVASTFTYELICFERASGKELVAYPTPPYDRSGGAHGTEWRDGKLWFNVPKTGRIFVMDPANGQIVHSIPCHGDRAHGIAWDPRDASLWSVDTNRRVIYKLNPYTGQILEAVGCRQLHASLGLRQDSVFELLDSALSSADRRTRVRLSRILTLNMLPRRGCETARIYLSAVADAASARYGTGDEGGGLRS